MGNGEFQMPLYSKQQWLESWRTGKNFYRNKITCEQFQLVRLPKVSPHANNSDFISRSLYPLPHTPKLIILAEQPHQILVLVQQYDSPISRYFSEVLLLVDLLLRIREISLIVQSLYHKYGPFTVKETHFGLNHRGQPLGWINQTKQSMQIQMPLSRYQNSEHAMIGQIIQISQKHSPVSLPMRFMQAQASSFTSFITFLTSMVSQEKSILSKLRRTQIKSKDWKKDNSMSPQFEKISFKNIDRKITNNFFNETQHKKRNGVPKFIKEGYKKFGLIDSLHHRKTVTIEGAEVVIRASPEKSPKTSPSHINRVRSMKGLHEPKKHRGSLNINADASFSYGQPSKQSNYPSTAQTGDYLTYSGQSGLLLKKKNYDRTSFWQSPSIKKFTSGQQSVHYTFKTAHSFRQSNQLSFISTKQKRKVEHSKEEFNIFNKLCSNMHESRIFQEKDRRSVIRQTEEESNGQSRMMEGETIEGNFQSTREGFLLDSIRDEFASIINL